MSYLQQELEKGILFNIQYKNIVSAKSQKIRGFKIAATGKLGIHMVGGTDTVFVILNDTEAEFFAKYIDCHHSLQQGRFFGRPCPTIPRHGFVDSRPIMTGNDVLMIWNETRKADPDGELLITPTINAECNAVVTPFMISLGSGHDGATNGNNALMLPTQGKLLSDSQRAESAIKESEYVEVVYANKDYYYVPTITQFRDGPEMPRSRDYIPCDVDVKRVIKVNGEDLLEWERIINELDDKVNSVVWHNGGALGSHYAVHCRLSEVAYITTFEPIVGQQVRRISEDVKINYPLVQRGLIYALSREMDKVWDREKEDLESKFGKQAMISVLYSLHHFNLLGSGESFLLGYSIGQVIRLCTAASLGELRHFSGIVANSEDGYKQDRSQVYQKYLSDITAGIEKLKLAEEIFNQCDYWSGSFGGRNWANCTRATIDLINAALQFERKQSKQWFNNLIAKFNIVINVAHNGGKFLNKFIENQGFDLAAENQAIFCAKYGNYLYKTLVLINGLEQTSRDYSKLKLIRNKLTRKEKAQFDLLISKATVMRGDDDDEDKETCANCDSKCCLHTCDEDHCAHCCDCAE